MNNGPATPSLPLVCVPPKPTVRIFFSFLCPQRMRESPGHWGIGLPTRPYIHAPHGHQHHIDEATVASQTPQKAQWHLMPHNDNAVMSLSSAAFCAAPLAHMCAVPQLHSPSP